jgi:hypothetical protein
MIVAVKRKDSKKLAMKVISIVAVILLFYWYYGHMSEQFEQQEMAAKEAAIKKIEKSKVQSHSKKIEKLVFKEIETAVDLIGQEYIRKVQVVDKKILIVCDANTKLDALKVRYGTMALVKNGLKDIKIAIDIRFIVENKYDEIE